MAADPTGRNCLTCRAARADHQRGHRAQARQALSTELERCDAPGDHRFAVALIHLNKEFDALPDHTSLNTAAGLRRFATEVHHEWHSATNTTCTYRENWLSKILALALSGGPR